MPYTVKYDVKHKINKRVQNCENDKASTGCTRCLYKMYRMFTGFTLQYKDVHDLWTMYTDINTIYTASYTVITRCTQFFTRKNLFYGFSSKLCVVFWTNQSDMTDSFFRNTVKHSFVYDLRDIVYGYTQFLIQPLKKLTV